MSAQLKVGLIVNPISGMGGKVGLHGTDRESFRTAIALGARPTSGERTLRAIGKLVKYSELFCFHSTTGDMGGDYLEAVGLSYQPLPVLTSRDFTSGQDSYAAALALRERGVDLILFSGGDGTARDIFSAIGGSIPILGIPSGVKMRSEVFGIYPESIPEILLAIAKSPHSYLSQSAEILDVSETLDIQGISETELFGVARTPRFTRLIQSSKTSDHSHGEIGLRELTEMIAKEMSPGKLYLIGPGKSAYMILEAHGQKGSYVGVDALVNGVVIGSDLSEGEILSLLECYEERELILGVIGGQGFLLGRGNQQISASVISQIGFRAITVIASAQKISALIPARLHVDLDLPDVHQIFPRYIQVQTAPYRTILCSIEVPSSQNAMTLV